MNIAYSLRQLGNQAIPFVMSGFPIDPTYEDHIRTLGIDTRGIVELDQWEQSSHAFIFTDQDQNQFTAFYSGPAEVENYSERLEAFYQLVQNELDFAILAPDIARNMIGAASLLEKSPISFLCDPGQQISDFTDEEITRLVGMSRYLVGNYYEVDRIRRVIPTLDSDLEGLFITNGAEGIEWQVGNQSGHEPAVKLLGEVDPTGCGDAFRAGLVHAWLLGAPWKDAVRSGALVAAINMSSRGAQSHNLSNFDETFQRQWGYRPSWS